MSHIPCKVENEFYLNEVNLAYKVALLCLLKKYKLTLFKVGFNNGILCCKKHGVV